MEYSSVLSPISVGALELKNRFIVPSMGTGMPTVQTGEVTPRLVGYWRARAKGGFALCIVEYAYVNQIGKGNYCQLGIYDDSLIPGLREVADAIHEGGAKASIQIHHAGRNAFRQRNGNEYTLAPSPIADPYNRQTPREMTQDDIYVIIEDYGAAALRAKKAGFDAIEIHGAHGYLPAAFISRASNMRTDEFGGDFAGRTRFPIAVIQSVKEKCGTDFPVGYRFSAYERIPGGMEIQESKAVARVLEQAGIDYISVSTGTHSSQIWTIAPPACAPGFNAYAAAEIKQSLSIPVVAVGRINHPDLAEEIIRSGQADLVALGRESIADPEFPNKVAVGNTSEICPCISCLMRCQGQFANKDQRFCSCTINPFAGLEDELRIEKAASPKHILIIGAGPAGLETAWVAAKRGHKVTVIERREHPGGQFRTASMPPFKQDISRAIKYYMTMGTKYGVSYRFGVEATPDLVMTESPDEVVLATGGSPLIPRIEGIDCDKVVTAADILDGKADAGDKVLIIGGGQVGVEVADYLGTQQRCVTIIEMLPQIGASEHAAIMHFMRERFQGYGLTVMTDSKITSISDCEVVYEKDGAVQRLSGFDTYVLALGTQPYNPLEAAMRDQELSVHVIGDALEARRALEAIYEGAYLGASL
jgi:2,4-dienoyl-CoA reductase-like NADH-dependent reductase (Old Yellow Enzyme family)/thioredoxin reductase